MKGPDDEAQEAHGRTDHCDPEGARGGDEDGRSVPQTRDQRDQLLQLESQVSPAAKREAVAHVCSAFELSERRACRMIGCVRMTVRYCSRSEERRVGKE